jgi:hypothetical protein
MVRRFVLPLIAIVGLAALSGPPGSRAVASSPPAPGTIMTIAGTGQAGFSGDGGPATQAKLWYPIDLTFDAAGNLCFTCGNDDTGNRGNRVRRISPDGTMTTVAGSGKGSFSGDGGPATAAGLDLPKGLAVDDAGHLYIADSATTGSA